LKTAARCHLNTQNFCQSQFDQLFLLAARLGVDALLNVDVVEELGKSDFFVEVPEVCSTFVESADEWRQQ